MSKGVLRRCSLGTTGLGMLFSGGVATVIGFHDVLWPVTLPGQILGAVFLLAGLAAAATSWLLADGAWRQATAPKLVYPSGQLSLMLAGAVGATYTNATIALYAYRYQPVKAIVFGLLAVLAAVLSGLLLPGAWGAVSRAAKATGLSLALVATGAGGWYQAIYLPQNAQVGIDYTLTLRSVVQSGANTLAELQLTMENVSSVTDLSVGSMVEVSGLTYERGHPGALSNNAAEQRLIDYAKGQLRSSSNVRFGGTVHNTVLAVLRPINNASYIFPDDTYTRDFIVVIPEKGFSALSVRILVQYVRTTRIVLGKQLPPAPAQLAGCKHDERYSWDIDQSALRTFTTGVLELHSDWCADLNNPFIHYSVSGIAGHESPAEEQSIAYRLGVYNSSRIEGLTFNYPQAAGKPATK